MRIYVDSANIDETKAAKVITHMKTHTLTYIGVAKFLEDTKKFL